MPPRKKLAQGVTKLKSGEFAVRPYDKIKKKKGPQVKFQTEAEAVAYKEKVDKGLIDPSSRAWTCDEWVEHWTTSGAFKRRKESTNLHNAERVRQFGEDFKGVPLIGVSREMARKWAGENVARVPAVRAMFNDAIYEGALDANPFAHIKVPKGPGRKYIKPMTEAEVQQLADCAYEKWPDWPVLGNLILFAAYSGLRRGETLALRWDDIDWQKGTIHVQRQWLQKPRTYGPPKNGHERIAPLLEQAANALRNTDRHESPDDELIWYSTRGKRIEPALLDYYWRQVRERFFGRINADRAKAIDLEWHTLRHFYISQMVDRGVPPHDIAEFVGHTDGGRLVQELYGHLYPDNAISRAQAAWTRAA